MGVEVSEPGVMLGWGELAEELLELAVADRAGGVSVVVARQDRDPARIDQEVRESLPGVEELGLQRRGGEIAGDEDMVRGEFLDPGDDGLESFESEVPGAARKQAGRPDDPLV